MKTSIIQLIFGTLWLGLSFYGLITGNTERFFYDLIISNIWIVGSQISRKLEQLEQ